MAELQCIKMCILNILGQKICAVFPIISLYISNYYLLCTPNIFFIGVFPQENDIHMYKKSCMKSIGLNCLATQNCSIDR